MVWGPILSNYCFMITIHKCTIALFCSVHIPHLFVLTDPTPYHNIMRRKRHESSSSSDGFTNLFRDHHKLRCAHILFPMTLASTPAIEDFNNDGRLEVSVPILWNAYPGGFTGMMMINPPKVLVKTFTLEDRVREVYGEDAAQVDFSSFVPASQQPWKKYMGSRGTGEFIVTSDS